MSDEFLGDRKKALEESFFAKENARLVEKLKAAREKAEAKRELASVTGISEDSVLDRMVDLGVGPDTWAAMSLVPLVEVAWADGNVKEAERRAVLAAAEANGVDPNGPGYELLQNWLESRPDARLFATWGEYVVGLCEDLTPAEREAMRDVVLGRARAVAEAAGGILGLVNKVSPEEKVVLGSIEKAFGVGGS